MSIEELLERHKILGNHPYITSILSIISTGTDTGSYTDADVEEYSEGIKNNLSLAYENYFELKFTLNREHLMVLVYHVITNGYDTDDTMAAIYFFMDATCGAPTDISQLQFNNVFNKVLGALSGDATKIPREMLSRFIRFIQTTTYILDDHFVDILIVVRNAIDHDPDAHITNVDSSDVERLAKFGYSCAKAILQAHDKSPSLQDLFQTVAFGLLQGITMGPLHQNALVFFRLVLKNYTPHLWFKEDLIKILILSKNPMLTVDIIKLLDKKDYESMVNGVINEYMVCSDECRPYFQETMSAIILNPYVQANYEDRQRQKQVDRIVSETCLRLCKCPLSEQETIMKFFIRWYDCKDINLRRTLQQMFNVDGEMSANNLFETLKLNVDINWQNKSYNITFLQLVLNMFYAHEEFMINHNVKAVEMLSFRGDACDIEYCLPCLTKVIQKYADQGSPVIKPLLGIITHFSLIPTQTGKRFLFEVYNLISLAWDRTSDAPTEFAILEVLLSPDMRPDDIFQALETYFPMTEDHLIVIYEERTLKYKETAWAFFSLLLNRYEVTAFPGYFEQTIANIDVDFYLRPEAIYMVQCINKVYQMKIQRNKLTDEDIPFTAKLLEAFYTHFMKCLVPIKMSNEIIMLIITLEGIANYDLPHFTQWKKIIPGWTLDNYSTIAASVAARLCTYIAHYVTIGDLAVDYDDCLRVAHILDSDQNIDVDVISSLILLLGKLCLKYVRLIHHGMTIMKKYLSYPNTHVKTITLTSLYDIANIRLQNFANFDTDLLKLIKYGDMTVEDATLRLLLELLGKEQVRLDRDGSVALMLAIVRRNINMDVFLKDSRENEQLVKSEKLIKNTFVYLIFYLNDFNEIKHYKISVPLPMACSYEYRCVIYRNMFKILQRQDQMNVLKVLCVEFVEPLYNGQIELNYKSLMILKDCITLVSYYASDNVANLNYDVQNFYEEFAPKIQKLLVADFNVKTISTDFNSDLKVVVHTLLKTLCKVERVSKDMLPQIYNTIALLTEAYYDNILSIVNEDNKIRDKFNIYHTYFSKYKPVILSEPISARIIADQEEWRRYTQEDL